MMNAVYINEVAPRDGLQSEEAIVPSATKVAFIDALSRSGVDEIEVSAFVSPKWVPQLGDAQEVFSRIHRNPDIAYSALVPNERGMDRAIECQVDKISVFSATSETFSQRNVNATIAESLERIAPVVRRARAADIEVRGYLSTCFWCPYEGAMDPTRTVELMQRLTDLGVDTLGVADTTGQAEPEQVRALLECLLPTVRTDLVTLHFHDTYGHAAQNARTAYTMGIRRFDSSTGGIGGCPFAPGARGNIATEVLVANLREVGASVAVDEAALETARATIAGSLG